jgi:hypothetical protein
LHTPTRKGMRHSTNRPNRLSRSGAALKTLICVIGVSALKISSGGGLAHSSDFPISSDTFDIAANSSQVFAGTKNASIHSDTSHSLHTATRR